jgi:hypothetical protein
MKGPRCHLCDSEDTKILKQQGSLVHYKCGKCNNETMYCGFCNYTADPTPFNEVDRSYCKHGG